ncbi:MAG: LptF/LptG family permease [Planctomycetia bacterium]|nr:LptF/LptG family permease [Planctomycetia bacterium]
MRIMTRYLLGQLLAVFFVSLSIITLLLVLVVVVKRAHEEGGLGAFQIAQLLPYVLPQALQFALPATALFSVSMVYGRMSSSNEVVALKALGISPWAILWPMLAAMTLLSLAGVWINDMAAGWSTEGIKRVIIGSIEEIAYGHLQSQRSFSTHRFSITVKGVDQRRLLDPIVTLQADEDSPSVMIRAEWAELKADPAADTLTLLLHNGSATSGGVQVDFPGTERRVLPLSESQRRGRAGAPAEMPLSQIPPAIVLQRQRIEDLQQQSASRAAFEMLTGELTELGPGSWQDYREQLRSYQHQLSRLIAEPYRRWAGGFCCLCFVMIGAPLAIRMRNANFLTSFFLCFLPILLVYYPLFMITFIQAKQGVIPPSAIWSANILIAVAGVGLMRDVMRY